MAIVFRNRPAETIGVIDLLSGVAEDKSATTAEWLAEFGQELQLCTFCGVTEASAFWHSPVAVTFCCAGCATTCLPSLAADALVSEHGHAMAHRDLMGRWLEATARFWRSVSSGLARCAAVARAGWFRQAAGGDQWAN
jgi:hypothetical protein